MHLRRIASRLALLSLFLLSSACGFHLRGMINLAPWLNNVAIMADETSHDLSAQLRSALQAYNININPEPSLANYWLIIEHEDFQQHMDSVSSGTTSRQYQLIYTVKFKFQKAKGKELIPSRAVVISRQITMNANRILGSNEEVELQKNEMRRDAGIQIINRISRSLPDNPH